MFSSWKFRIIHLQGLVLACVERGRLTSAKRNPTLATKEKVADALEVSAMSF